MSLSYEPMTRPARIEAQCLGKRAFLTFTEAQRQAKHKRWPRDIYRCPHCRQWHIGGKGPRFRKEQGEG